jgi:hypothetical protein
MNALEYNDFLATLNLFPYNPLNNYSLGQRVFFSDPDVPIFNIYESNINSNVGITPYFGSDNWQYRIYVLVVSDPVFRQYVEDWCDVNTPNDVIRFTEDGNGNWFIVSDNLDYYRWEPLRSGLLANGEWIEWKQSW